MYLDVAATTIDFLLMLDSELDDECLVLVGEGGETSGGGVESGVLGSLQSLHFVPLAGFQCECSIIILVLRL